LKAALPINLIAAPLPADERQVRPMSPQRIGQSGSTGLGLLSHRCRVYMIVVRALMRCCRGPSCGGTTDEHDELLEFRILADLLEQCHDAILSCRSTSSE
jgi:hypothetical protein